MSATWIEVRITLPDHRKAKAAARQLALRRPWLIGHLVCLWAWAMENVPADGSLAGIDDADLEDAAQWPEDRAGQLVPAMVDAGFIDVDRTGRYLHDWEDYTGRLLRRREEDRARKAAERAAARAAKTSTEPPKPARKRRTRGKPSAAGPADKPERPSDSAAKSSGQKPMSSRAIAPAGGRARAGGRPDRTLPHRTGTKPEEVPSARATPRRGRRARASVLSITGDDPRRPVAELLAGRFRWTAITDEQWAMLAEVVDNEYPAGTTKGRDPAVGWQWLAEQLGALPKDAGSPLDAFLATYNAELEQRRAAADQAEADWEATKRAPAGPIAAELGAKIGSAAGTNGHRERLGREELVERFRTYRGQIADELLEPQLARHGLTLADLEDPVNFDEPPQEAAHG